MININVNVRNVNDLIPLTLWLLEHDSHAVNWTYERMMLMTFRVVA